MQKERRFIAQQLIPRCPECGSQNLVQDNDSGEIVCMNCGLVLGQIMDKGPEWRAFTPEERESRARVGAPPLFSVNDKGLMTQVGGPRGVSYDIFGRALSSEKKSQMWRLRRWQVRSRYHTSTERNLARAMTELHRLSDKLYIPGPVKEKAAITYRKAVDKGLVRGRTIANVVAAALYVACRMNGNPRTLLEISKVSAKMNGVGVRWHKKKVARCYRLLLKGLKIQMPVASPIIYLSKIAEMTGISGEAQGLAIRILRQAYKGRLTHGKDPLGLAASALYIASRQNNENITQKDLAKAVGVTEVTIRNRYKELKEELDLEIPEKGEKP